MPRPVVPIFAAPIAALARLIERDVMRQDQRARLGDAQALRHVDAGALQLAHLLEQRLRRQHHAVADEAGHAVVQDAGGNQPQDGLACR